jgi:hypothetical protein
VRSEFLHGAVLQDGDGAAFPGDGCAELLDGDDMVLLDGDGEVVAGSTTMASSARCRGKRRRLLVSCSACCTDGASCSTAR